MLANVSVMRGVVLGAVCASLSIVLQIASSTMMMKLAAGRLVYNRARILKAFYASSYARRRRSTPPGSCWWSQLLH